MAAAGNQFIFIQGVFRLFVFLLLFLTIAIPNSLQFFTAAIMLICFILALLFVRINHYVKFLVFLHCCNVTVTLCYIAVGYFNNAPLIAILQVFIIYIISPFLWIFISIGIIQTIGINLLIRWITYISFACIITVAIFFLLFFNFGPEYVTFFIKAKPNIHFQDGYVGATMYVYGSLIFLSGAFLSTPEIVTYKKIRYILLPLLLAAGITSGRSALILSIPIGIFLGLIIPSKFVNIPSANYETWKICKRIFNLGLIGVISGLTLQHFASIDLIFIIIKFLENIINFGGIARIEQYQALLDGIIKSYGLGMGHGIGVNYIRNYNFPWRYELVWLSSIFRVGLFGTLIYSSPFVYYFFKISKPILKHNLLPQDKFFFSGFLCAFIASFTNPYFESFVFQWMYILPLVVLLSRISVKIPILSMRPQQRVEKVIDSYCKNCLH